MFNYTNNNHFKFGYNKEWFRERKDDNDRWTVQYGQCERKAADFRTECIRAAELIWENRGGLPIDIFFSGGSDSEIVLRSFLELKVPFNVHIMRYDQYLNAHDWCYAYVTCQQLDLQPIFHDLDIEDFWSSGRCLEYAETSKCVSPQLLTHMWLMDRVDGIPVMGSADPYTARTDIADKRDFNFTKETYDNGTPWAFFEREKIAAWYRYPMKKGRAAVPGFLQYTPEMVYAFLDDDLSRRLHQNQMIGKLSNKSSKFKIYQKYWPELVDRKKWSGFELVLDLDKSMRDYLRKTYANYEREYWFEVNELMRYFNREIDYTPPNLSPDINNPSFKNHQEEDLAQKKITQESANILQIG